MNKSKKSGIVAFFTVLLIVAMFMANQNIIFDYLFISSYMPV